MFRSTRPLLPIKESMPSYLKALIDGHNKGKWTVATDPFNEASIRKIVLRGQRSLLQYEIDGSSAVVSQNRDMWFCVRTSSGNHNESVLPLALMIKSHEKLFLKEAVPKFEHSTLKGGLKYMYATAWVLHPLTMIALLIVILGFLCWPFLPSTEPKEPESKPGSVVCQKIPGTNKVKC